MFCDVVLKLGNTNDAVCSSNKWVPNCVSLAFATDTCGIEPLPAIKAVVNAAPVPSPFTWTSVEPVAIVNPLCLIGP